MTSPAKLLTARRERRDRAFGAAARQQYIEQMGSYSGVVAALSGPGRLQAIAGRMSLIRGRSGPSRRLRVRLRAELAAAIAAEEAATQTESTFPDAASAEAYEKHHATIGNLMAIRATYEDDPSERHQLGRAIAASVDLAFDRWGRFLSDEATADLIHVRRLAVK